MECINNSYGWCSIALSMIGDEDSGDPSYDEELMCDNEGCCVCSSDDDFKNCECFEE